MYAVRDQIMLNEWIHPKFARDAAMIILLSIGNMMIEILVHILLLTKFISS